MMTVATDIREIYLYRYPFRRYFGCMPVQWHNATILVMIITMTMSMGKRKVGI